MTTAIIIDDAGHNTTSVTQSMLLQVHNLSMFITVCWCQLTKQWQRHI